MFVFEGNCYISRTWDFWYRSVATRMMALPPNMPLASSCFDEPQFPLAQVPQPLPAMIGRMSDDGIGQDLEYVSSGLLHLSDARQLSAATSSSGRREIAAIRTTHEGLLQTEPA
jgi:hypothetical protein